jgi:hypothetical protein
MKTIVVSALLLAAVVTGCSQHMSSPMQPAMRVVSSMPADGATAVRLDAGVTLDFGTAVNRGAVEGSLHLLAEPDMFSACPDPSMGSHGTMESVMNDTNMLLHMDQVHATAGSFSWNAAGTACTFHPGSLMLPQTRYMVHMNGGMMAMMRQMGVGMMGGQMNSAGDMMLHFETMTADGHAGHH